MPTYIELIVLCWTDRPIFGQFLHDFDSGVELGFEAHDVVMVVEEEERTLRNHGLVDNRADAAAIAIGRQRYLQSYRLVLDSEMAEDGLGHSSTLREGHSEKHS